MHYPGNRSEIAGIILVKELIMVDHQQGRTVGQLKIRSMPSVRAGERTGEREPPPLPLPPPSPGVTSVRWLFPVSSTCCALPTPRAPPTPRPPADTPLYDMLKLFEVGRSHMAVLVDDKKAAASSSAG